LWDVISKHDSQLRIAPSGSVIGVDAASLIRIAELLGYDLYPFTLLLPYAEGGMVTGINSHQEAQES
jgi:hypothetical protein